MTKALVIAGHSNRRDPAWTELISAIYTQAIRDARSDADPIKALDAALWLAGPDAEIYLDAVGLDADPLVILINGRARKMRRIAIGPEVDKG